MRETTLCYIEKDNHYLMLCRSPKKKDGSVGKWLGVGGKIEEGETPDECIVRETKEETGLRLTRYRQRGVIRYYSDVWEDEIMYLYTADGFEGELVDACDEGELRWIPMREVLNLKLWEGDKIFLQKLMDGEQNIRLSLTYHGDDLINAE